MAGQNTQNLMGIKGVKTVKYNLLYFGISIEMKLASPLL